MGAPMFSVFVAQVEAEFGEPARDVLAGFRQMGLSWRDIAGALELVGEDSVRRYAIRLGAYDGRKLYRYHGAHETLSDRARRLGFASLDAMVADARQRGLTNWDVARRLKAHYCSVVKATKDKTMPRPRTARQRESALRVVAAINQRRRSAYRSPAGR